MTAALLSCASAAKPTSSSVPQPRLSYAQLLGAAQDALVAGNAEAAATLAADACRLDASRPEAYLVRGQALAQNDHVARSSEAFEHARALGCRDTELFMALASNYDVEHRYQDAVAVYIDYLHDHPHDATMRDELALTYLLLGDANLAIAQLRTALRDAPGDVQIRQDLGYALIVGRAFAEAETYLAQVCRAETAPPEASRLYVQALAGQHKWDEALQVVNTVLRQHPDDRDAKTLKAQLLTKATAAPAQAAPTQTPDSGQAGAAQAEDGVFNSP